MKLCKSQTGFTAFHILLLLILLGIIGFTGWRVYDMNKSSKPVDSSATPTPAAKKEEAKIHDGFVEYQNKELGFKFAYPKEWGNANLRAYSKTVCSPKEITDRGIKVTGEKYDITFSENEEKSIIFKTKDFSVSQYYPCLTTYGEVAAPKVYENAKTQGFYKDGETEYIAASDALEGGADYYCLYAVKPINTSKINGVSVAFHKLPFKFEGGDDPVVLEKAKATLTDEDKKVMNTFKAL